MNTVDFAKFYAKEMRWDVFPLKPRDKVPAVKWADVASHEENMAIGWFDTDPNANIGIATGSRSGVVVLDIDAEHGGYESLQAIIEVHGLLPKTPVVKTGGGGEHIYFRHPGDVIRNSTSRLAPGIDIRGDGGYVVAAPSVHPNGKRYEWVVEASETPLADMPDWMIAALKDTPAKDIPIVANGKIYNGGRNNTLASMAGSMRARGFDEDAIFQALVTHNNAHCVPPLTDGEVLIIARSISRYEPKQKPVVSISSVKDGIIELDAFVEMRANNPSDVWGIHYAWPLISKITGGKQRGELTILAGDTGLGKSYWSHWDAAYSAIGDKNISPTPTLIWSGEMRRRQVYQRIFSMLGVSNKNMKAGRMTETDWQYYREAKALLMNSPLRVADMSLRLDDLDGLLEREVGEYGIQYVVLDYDWLIEARGESEIQTSQAISRQCKLLAQKHNLAIMLISSINKSGMDAENTKANISGSGKKLFDADNVFMLTKYKEGKTMPRYKGSPIMPDDFWKLSTLRIDKGRELDILPSGRIHYYRANGPKFEELAGDRADIGD